MKKSILKNVLTILIISWGITSHGQSGGWSIETTSDGSTCTGRDETSYIDCNSKFYLLGGRGNLNIQEYDPEEAKWITKNSKTDQLNHFQAVSLNGKIYIIGALTGAYPTETPVPNVYVYDPVTDVLSVGDEIPENRRRGSTGAVVYNNKIYVVSGITNGHTSGHVAWFDSYDPATGAWTELPDVPHPRDHFNATIHGNKLYVASGRKSSYPDTFGPVVNEVDVYDFTSGTWSTLPNNLPTPRAGTAVITYGNEVIVIGGESMSQQEAHAEVEALDVNTNQWRDMPSLVTGRHGTQAVVYNNKIYIPSGVANRGGSPSVANQEIYSFVLNTTQRKNNSQEIKVFPNPCSDYLTISLSNSFNEELSLEIFNASGVSCMKTSYTPDYPINVNADLKPGFYLVRIFNQSGQEIGKLNFMKD